MPAVNHDYQACRDTLDEEVQGILGHVDFSQGGHRSAYGVLVLEDPLTQRHVRVLIGRASTGPVAQDGVVVC